jgi:colanic acid biosynthesis protein WcaM
MILMKRLGLPVIAILMGSWGHGNYPILADGTFPLVSNVAMSSIICNVHGAATGTTCNLTSDLPVSNQNLNIATWTFTGSGQIALSGSAALVGNGTLSNGSAGTGAVFIQNSGAYSIQGITCTAVTQIACISVVPTISAVISFFNASLNTFTNINYGILRNGGLGAILQTQILNNTFTTAQGDPIELNVIPNDRNITISGNNITGVNNTTGLPDQGIAIGVAGATFDNTFPDGVMAQNITITGNTINGAVQGIHVEAGKNFTISNNKVMGISASLSTGSGLQETGIVTFGCNNFSVLNNNVSTVDAAPMAIFIAAGALNSVFIGFPITFTIDSNVIDNTSSMTGTQWSTVGNPTVTNNSGFTFTSQGSIPPGFVGGGASNIWVTPWTHTSLEPANDNAPMFLEKVA